MSGSVAPLRDVWVGNPEKDPVLPMAVLAEELKRYAGYDVHDPAGLHVLSQIWDTSKPRGGRLLFPASKGEKPLLRNADMRITDWQKAQRKLERASALPELPLQALDAHVFELPSIVTRRRTLALLLLEGTQDRSLHEFAECLWNQPFGLSLPDAEEMMSWEQACALHALDPAKVRSLLKVVEAHAKVQIANELTGSRYALSTLDALHAEGVSQPAVLRKCSLMNAYVRWLIRRDMPEVLDIERQSFEFPWTEQDFLNYLRQRNVIGMVAECNHRIIGFMVYELHKRILNIINFAVDPEFRREGVGSMMVEKLIDKLSQQRRQQLTLTIRLGNSEGQTFFRKCGFVPEEVLLHHFEQNQPAVKMRYSLPTENTGGVQEKRQEDVLLLYQIFAPLLSSVQNPEQDEGEKAESDDDLEEGDDDIDEEVRGDGDEDHEEDADEGEEVQGDQGVQAPEKSANVTEQSAPELLQDIVELMRASPDNWQKGMQSMRSLLLPHQKAFASILLREGWKTVTHTKEITDAEWKKYVSQGPSDRALDRVMGRKKKQETTLRPLSEAIEAKRHRREREHWIALKSIESADAKERAIISEVFAAVLKYGYASGRHSARYFRIGTPQFLSDEREVSCFTGPWLAASMLLQCGIPYERMFFCNVLGHSRAYMGAHAALMVTTRNRHTMVLDIGHRTIGQPLRPSLLLSKQMRWQFTGLLEGRHGDPTMLEMEPNTAKVLDLPNRMQVMPVFEGFSSSYLLHTGLALAAQKKMEEARRAFELGLTFNPEHPQLHYELGLAHFRYGDPDLAERYLSQALRIDDHVKTPHFTLGELCLSRGDIQGALRHFDAFIEDGRELFGDEGALVKQAWEYINASGRKILDLWKEKQMKAGLDGGEKKDTIESVDPV